MTRLRVIVTTTMATVTGLLTLAFRRGDRERVELKPGDPAPEFALVGSDGVTYRLSAYTGHCGVVLVWFPKAFTGGCTAQCESIGSNRERLRQTGFAIFGANRDTPRTNGDFARSLGLDFPILSDVDGSVARAYGVLGASGFPARWTFYIGADGRVVSIDRQVRVASHGQDIERALLDMARR